MTFRTRLALILGALVLIPLVAAAVLVVYAVPRAAQDRADSLVVSTRSSVTAALTNECQRSQVAARSVGRDAAYLSPKAAAHNAVDDGLADWAVLLSTSDRVLGEAGALPEGAASLGAADCEQGTADGPTVTADVDVAVVNEPDVAKAKAANLTDNGYLKRLNSSIGFTGEVTLFLNEKVVASSESEPSTQWEQFADAASSIEQGQTVFTQGNSTFAVARAEPGMPFDVVVAVPSPDNGLLIQTVFLVVLIAVILAIFVAVIVARDMTQPLEDVTEAAEFVASGDLSRRIDIQRDDEIGRLANAFNHMTDELQEYVAALEGSRDALRGNLDRLGNALSATHDLQTLLPVVLETAMSSVGAGAGLVLLGDSTGDLTVQTEHGMRTRGLKVPRSIVVGEGLLGSVAGSGLAARGVIGSNDELQALSDEPQEGEVLAVPLRRSPQVFGVIALFAPDGDTHFTQEDESALMALAGQAAIAVDNVMLHSEAQRASTIDSLTGLWNFRYLTDSLNREIERAVRFDRSLALLMLDLDWFKRVNDTYGHQRGDDVLREFATRVTVEIREVDTLARYGGEEFVLVLPETTTDGAVRLAERICDAIRSYPFGSSGETPLPVTVSIGVAVFPHHASSATALLRAADRALYQAKNSGRDRWSVAEPSNVSVDR